MKSIEAYLAGVAVGDGHLERCASRTVFYTSDIDYAEKLQALLDSIDCSPSMFFDENSEEFRIATRSKEFHETLTKRFGVKVGDKTTHAKEIKVSPKNANSFLAGIFDAEAWHELDKNQYHRVRLKMKSRKVVKFVHDLLQEKDFKPTMHERSDGSSVVEINRQKSVRRLLKNLPLIHPRWLSVTKVLSVAEAPNPPGNTRATMRRAEGCDPERGS